MAEYAEIEFKALSDDDSEHVELFGQDPEKQVPDRVVGDRSVTVLFPDGNSKQTLTVPSDSTVAFFKTQIKLDDHMIPNDGQDVKEENKKDAEADSHSDDEDEDCKEDSKLITIDISSDAPAPDSGIPFVPDSHLDVCNWDLELVFMGQKLKDEDTLESAGIEDGMSIHCVKISKKSEKEAEPVTHNDDADGRLAAGLLIAPQVDADGLGLSREPNIGTRFDFALGLVLGMLLGFISLIWVWQWRVSRRQKMGIMLGIMINVMFSFMRNPEDETSADPASMDESAISITTETSRRLFAGLF